MNNASSEKGTSPKKNTNTFDDGPLLISIPKGADQVEKARWVRGAALLAVGLKSSIVLRNQDGTVALYLTLIEAQRRVDDSATLRERCRIIRWLIGMGESNLAGLLVEGKHEVREDTWLAEEFPQETLPAKHQCNEPCAACRAKIDVDQ